MATLFKVFRDTTIKYVTSRKTMGKDHLGNVYYVFKEGYGEPQSLFKQARKINSVVPFILGHPERRQVKQSGNLALEDFESHHMPVRDLDSMLDLASPYYAMFAGGMGSVASVRQR